MNSAATENLDSFEMPWHRLGTKLNRPATAKQAICDAGLNHTVSKKQLYVGEERHPWPGFYALVRDDTWNNTEPSVLRYAQADYIPLQNTDAFSFLDPIVANGGVFYESAGPLREAGAWLMVRSQADIEIAPGDDISCFLLLTHGQGVSACPRPGTMFVRLASKSILGHGFVPASLLQIVRSAEGSPQFAENPDKVWETICRLFEKAANQFRAMLQIEMNTEQVQEYLGEVFRATFLKKNEKGKLMIEPEQDCKECLRLFAEGEGNNLPGVKGTLWAAYNAVAEYIDFHTIKSRNQKFPYDASGGTKHRALILSLRMAKAL